MPATAKLEEGGEGGKEEVLPEDAGSDTAAAAAANGGVVGEKETNGRAEEGSVAVNGTTNGGEIKETVFVAEYL